MTTTPVAILEEQLRDAGFQSVVRWQESAHVCLEDQVYEDRDIVMAVLDGAMLVLVPTNATATNATQSPRMIHAAFGGNSCHHHHLLTAGQKLIIPRSVPFAARMGPVDGCTYLIGERTLVIEQRGN